MGYFSIILMGVGLAMDGFAVSLAKGMNLSKINTMWSPLTPMGIFTATII